ncbi:dihydroorotase [Achromatium sp. WMS1]|nr:dihydroorotase [Achromatium sp. WMS1]
MISNVTTLTITRPDDWHLHLRDGEVLSSIVPHSTRCFARAIVMPNLKPPIINLDQALAYKKRIVAVLPNGCNFMPLMTLYLTEHLTTAEIQRAVASGIIYAVKLYPSGVTTNSGAGIKSIERIFPILEFLEKLNVPLLIHAEVSDLEVDIFDRERGFIDRYLTQIVNKFPALRIVIEHITTCEAIDFVHEASEKIAATITVQHLLYNRNAMLMGGIRPHLYCLPILKEERHRQALLAAAISGHPRFFLGTDSAPHAKVDKECACGCAGVFTAHAAIELYAEIFDQAGALERLEAFAAFHGADFYGLPRNQDYIQLVKSPWIVPQAYAFGRQKLIPLCAGETINWQLVKTV